MPRNRWRAAVVIVLASVAAFAAVADVSTNRLPSGPYLRVTQSDSNIIRLEIAARKFLPERRRLPEIWLVGVSHVGEPAYYEALQKHLDNHGLVLYEGVSDRLRSNTPDREKDGTNPVPSEKFETLNSKAKGFSIQASIAEALGLVFQLDAINYRRPHFRNSDLTLAEMERLLEPPKKEEGDAAVPASSAEEAFQDLMQLMDGSSGFAWIFNAGLRLLGSSPKLQALGRLAMIETLDFTGGNFEKMHGLAPELVKMLEVLVEARNRKVIADARRAFRIKPRPKSIAIFYGAAHMSDMEQRLIQELHYRPSEQLWLTAFSVELKRAGVTPADIAMVRSLVQWQLRQLQTETNKVDQPAPEPASSK